LRTRATFIALLVAASLLSYSQNSSLKDSAAKPLDKFIRKDSFNSISLPDLETLLKSHTTFRTSSTLTKAFRIPSVLSSSRLQNNLPINLARQFQLNQESNPFSQQYIATLRKALEAPIQINSISALYSGLYQAAPSVNESVHVNDLNFQAGMSLLSIPVQLKYIYQDYSQSGQPGLNVFSFKYDLDAYSQSLKKLMGRKFNPKDFLPENFDPVELLKTQAENALRHDIRKLKEQYKGLLDGHISKIGDLQNIALQDLSGLRQQLLQPKWLEELTRKADYFAQLQTRIQKGEKVDEAILSNLENELESYEGIKALFAKIEEHKAKWAQSGLIEKMKESKLLQNQKLLEIARDPRKIALAAQKELNLNSIQKLFLKISKLNLGQSTPNISSLSAGKILFQGLHSSLLTRQGSIAALAGNMHTFNSIQDLAFANAIHPNDNHLLGFQMNRNINAGNQSSLSFLTFQTLGGNQFSFPGSALPRRSQVITIREVLELDKANRIDVELSKSASSLVNGLDADSNQLNPKLQNLMGEGSFLGNTAISLQYNGSTQDIGLEHDLVIRFAGLQYNNPSSSFVPAGTKEAGVNLKKQFLKTKLQLMVRSNWREYQFSSQSDWRWQNFYSLADLKWKMRKGQYVSLRYQPSKYLKVSDGTKMMNSSLERIAANASLIKKFGRFQYRNNLTLAYQENKSFVDNSLVANISLQITSFQNFFINGRSFFNNTTYNYVDQASSFIFYNSTFHSEWGTSYSIGTSISATTGLNYQSVKDWYQQIAFRQTISGQLGKTLNIYLYIDAGKNIKILQPVPYGPVRAECSIQYQFNQ